MNKDGNKLKRSHAAKNMLINFMAIYYNLVKKTQTVNGDVLLLINFK